MRATVSPAFPAVNGLITLIGLAGHVSALAATVAIERAIAAKDADDARIDIMFCSRRPVTPRWALARRAEVDLPFSRKRAHLAMALVPQTGPPSTASDGPSQEFVRSPL